jgi:hypothetical protein
MARKRSIGITICAYLMIILPFRFYIDSVLVFLFLSIPISTFPKFILQSYIQRPYSIFLQLIGVILGVGLLQLKKWALKYVFILNWFGALIGIIALFLPVNYDLSSKIYTIISSVFFVWFFTRPKVKEQFK